MNFYPRDIPNRREFLARTGSGAGMLALCGMLRDASARDASFQDGLQRVQKAKNVIWLFMNGGPSGIDTFDHKPELQNYDGQFFSEKIDTLFPHPGPVMKSPYQFKKYGQCGASVSEIFPNVAKHVDDIAFIKSCVSTELNHGPACYMMNSGNAQVGSPCLGSFANYGLGTENDSLPGFVVMLDHRRAPEGGKNLWSSGFLPAANQGVTLQTKGDPVLYVHPSGRQEPIQQKKQLDFLQKLNSMHAERNLSNDVLDARIKSFETAYKMQMSVPELTNIDNETKATEKLYGLNQRKTRPFGKQMLLARRMVEKGVRFIQVYHGGFENNWDDHSGLKSGHRKRAAETDLPIAGLLADLKQRNLLDSTLIVWGGDFGRLPISQDKDGRDHNPLGFTMWMAGGGSKGGISYGATDQWGYRAIENPVSMHDMHATVLHLMGIDHEALTYQFGGREQTITNGLGHVVKGLCS